MSKRDLKRTHCKNTVKIILVFALSLMFWPALVARGAISLTINGQDVDSILLEHGQSCTVEVVSDDSSSYEAYVGFDNGLVLGSFSHLETRPEAGERARAEEYDEPVFYGYFVKASGFFPGPVPGVHFVFEYVAQQPGETDLKLYDETFTTVIDSVHIVIESPPPAAMGTAFTYQGSLLDSNSPANGLYDFQFRLYNQSDPSFAVQQGSTIDINDLDVIDGQFTVVLDFGSDPNIFNGEARWLQITVAQSDGSDPCTLSPMWELTPAPYAIFARNGGVDNDWMVSGDDMYSIPTGNVGIGTDSPRPSYKLTVDGGSDSSGIYVSCEIGELGIETEGGIGIMASGLTAGGHFESTGGSAIIARNDYGIAGEFDGDVLVDGDIDVSGDAIFEYGGIGIGTTSPNEKLTVNDALSLGMIPPPSASAGYGKLYVKSTDGQLYFINEAGTEYKLSAASEDFVAGDYLLNANDTERSTSETSMTLLKETKIGRGGTLKIKFTLATDSLNYVYAQIYRNGSPVGTLRSIAFAQFFTFTEDISGWSKDDLVQIWGRSNSSLDRVIVFDFRLYVDNPPVAGARL
jgi:hypothetical protein